MIAFAGFGFLHCFSTKASCGSGSELGVDADKLQSRSELWLRSNYSKKCTKRQWLKVLDSEPAAFSVPDFSYQHADGNLSSRDGCPLRIF
jgi:hypothetical protein